MLMSYFYALRRYAASPLLRADALPRAAATLRLRYARCCYIRYVLIVRLRALFSLLSLRARRRDAPLAAALRVAD